MTNGLLRVAPLALLTIYTVGQLVEIYRRRTWESRAETDRQDIREIAEFAARESAARTAILEQFPAVRHLQVARDTRRA